MPRLNKVSKLILTFALLFVLSACGSSLAKPTGLEEAENEKLEVVQEESEEADQKEEKEEASVDEAVDEESAEEVKEAKSIKNQSTEKSEGGKSTAKTTTSIDNKSNANAKKSSTNTIRSNKVDKPSQQQVKKATNSESSKRTTTQKNTNKTETKQSTTNSKQVEEKIKPTPEQKPNNTITISIVISSGEVPLPPTEMEIKDGDSILDALIAITKSKRIQMDYRGGQGASAYVEGIANVYEFDRGPGSGWMYRVNGIFPDRSAGVIPLQAGDRVEWLYTTNLGQDLNADLKPFRR